jgi:hypothetical protein
MGGRDPPVGVKSVRPVWRQQGDQFGFCARDESQLVAGGHEVLVVGLESL